MTTEELPKKRRSHSQLGQWLRCQRAYGYKYVLKLPMKWNWFLGGGIAYGDSLNKYHLAQIEGTTEFTNTNNLTLYMDALLDELSDTHQMPKNLDFNNAKIDAGKLIPIYVRTIGHKMHPKAIEAEVNPVIAGVEQLGFIDLLNEEGDGTTIYDHKFNTQKPQESSARDSLQLINYDMGFDDPTHKVGLLHAVRYKRSPQIMVRYHTVTPADRGRLIKVVGIMDSLIDQGFWLATDPNSWACSPTHCDYWNNCRGREGGPLPLPGEEGYEAPEATR